ncbi:hypothetical protein B0J15DRAFT_487649 [Fusarium solani]|uniref:Secreted protein n=1 Tax=Fusarium solani TaxID=169388 RepID=A0A9P9HYR9_FUSSL|nr:uncharacterized protein B0J15DRAFT_487649 [Fusarium solani]KAH7266015.1 hypothetical protein B0J15DRAFT_487649 [Fusarium solani]
MNILMHLTPLLFSLALRLFSNTSIQPDKRLSLLSRAEPRRPIKAGLTTCCAACPPCELTAGRDRGRMGLRHVQLLAHRALHPAAD